MSEKKRIEITGRLLFPITIGESALIQESDGDFRRTSTVVNCSSPNQMGTDIAFETCNTNYLLHLMPGGVMP